MDMYLGVNCLSLHVLLYQTAAFVLYSFSFEVSTLMYFFCLFGIDKFDIHGTVHC